LELSEQWKTQFNDLTYYTQVQQSSPKGLEAHGIGAIEIQVEETAPGSGEDYCTMIADCRAALNDRT
jgi:hypothetical protein